VKGNPSALEGLVDLQNIGSGAEVYAGKTGVIGDVRTITHSGQVTVSQSADELNIDGKYPQTEYCFDPLTEGVGSWMPQTYFRYPGTAVVTPTAIRAVVEVNNVNNPGDIRIRDDGTGLIIAQLLGVSLLAPHIVTLVPTFANLAVAPSVLAIDLQHIGNGNITLFSLTIEY
jgi:hypothetical protein